MPTPKKIAAPNRPRRGWRNCVPRAAAISRKPFLKRFPGILRRDREFAPRGVWHGRPKSFGQISEPDFQNLLQALSATTKGRSFLAEYRRRSGPEETFELLDSLQRIERAIASVRDQLQPERIADELSPRRDDARDRHRRRGGDPDGDETARRFALVGRGAASSSPSLAADGLARRGRPVLARGGMRGASSRDRADSRRGRAFLDAARAGAIRASTPER